MPPSAERRANSRSRAFAKAFFPLSAPGRPSSSFTVSLTAAWAGIPSIYASWYIPMRMTFLTFPSMLPSGLDERHDMK